MSIKFITKHKTTTLSVLILLIIFGVLGWRIASQSRGEETVEEVLKQVQLLSVGDYQENNSFVTAIGQIESMDQVELKSQLSAEITSVNVAIGDEVKKGQLLIELDHASLDAQLMQASAGIEKSQGALNQYVAGATDEQIEQAEKAVEAAQAGLDQAEANLEQVKVSNETTIKSAEIALSLAQSSLGNTSTSTQQAIANAYDNLKILANSSLSYVYTALTQMGDIFGEEPGSPSADDAYSDVLGAKDFQTKNEAKNQFEDTKEYYNTAKLAYNELDNNSSQDEIDAVISKVEEMTDSCLEALNLTRTTLDNTVSNYNFSNASLSALKSNIDLQITYVNTVESSLESAKQATKTAKLSDTSSGDSNEIALEKAEQDLEQAQKQAEANLSIYKAAVTVQESALKQAEASLKQILADPRDVDLSSYNASVTETQAAYSLIASNREKAFIRAPFDGVVSSVPVKSHDFAVAGASLVTIINDNGLQVKTYISDQDRKLINEGADVVIDEDVEGVVTRISPGIDSTTKKVEIIVAVTDEDAVLTVGQYVETKIAIMEDAVENIFFIPLQSVKVTPDASYVLFVNDENIIEEQVVETGRIIDVSIEITSGLNPDMNIISSVRGLEVGEKVSIN